MNSAEPHTTHLHALRAVGRARRALVRATDGAALLRELCTILVEHGGFRAATVLPASKHWSDGGEVTLALEQDGRQWGTLVLTPPDGDRVDPDELEALRALSEDVAWTLRRIERDAQNGLALSAALAASEARTRALLEASTDTLFVHDARGRLIDVNARACQGLGYTRDELLRLTVADIEADFKEEVAQLTWTTSDPRTERTFRGRHRRKDGSTFPVELRLGRMEAGGEQLCLVVARDLTEREHAEEAVRASEQLYRAMFDVAPLGLTEADPVTGLLYRVNERLCAITGYERDELLSLRIAELTHPDDRETSRKDLEALATGKTREYHAEKRYVRKDGRTTWVSVHATKLRGWPGGPMRLLATVEDITARREAAAERKAADEALRASEERFRSVLKSLALPLGIADSYGNPLFLNDAFTEHYGFTRDDFADAVTFGELVYPDPAVRQRVARAFMEHLTRPETLQTQADRAFVVPFACKDGRSRDVELNVRRVGDLQIASFHDVTERVRTDKALREAEERHRLALDAAEQGTFRHDAKTDLVEYDERAREQFGFERRTCHLSEAVARCHPDDRELMREAIAELMSATGPARGRVEHRIVLPSGETRWISVHTRSVFAGEGAERHADHLIATTQDITSARSTEEQLRTAQRMEAVGRLAGGVAHDFNNLLSVILSYTELALDELRKGDPLRGDLEEIDHAATRAEGLTRQLLAFSRRQVLNLEVLDVNELVANTAKMLGRLIGEDVELEILAADDLSRTRADRGQIEQVLMNLAVNARDAMAEGGRLSIDTADVDLGEARAEELGLRAGRHVELRVSDTGCGMDAQTRARIFEPFFTTKELGKGTGLGLSTVYGIVRQTGGAIDVESTPGEGTTFRIFLPCHADDGVLPAPRREVTGSARGRGETVLVVDDEAALCRVVRRVLASAGYRVFVASNAGEALLFCEDRGAEVDLVLTDVVMPGTSGPRLTERLAPLCPRAKVLFMSGYTDDALAHHELRPESFIHKPFDGHTLTGRVRALLDQD